MTRKSACHLNSYRDHLPSPATPTTAYPWVVGSNRAVDKLVIYRVTLYQQRFSSGTSERLRDNLDLKKIERQALEKAKADPFVNLSQMLILFFFIAFLVAWLFFITAGLMSNNTQLSALSRLLIFMGAISPGLIAVSLTAITKGGEGVKLLINKISFKRTRVLWYIFAVTFIAFIKGLAALVFFLLYDSWPQFGTTAWYIMLFAIAVSMWVQAAEEIGWRGFALPIMSKKFGLAMSSILLGIIWATWHLPLFYITAADTFNQSFPLYLLQVTGLSVIMAWLFWKVNGNLLPLMVFHAAINNTKDIVPSASKASASPFTLNASPIGWISLALIWVVAFFAIYAMTRKPTATIS